MGPTLSPPPTTLIIDIKNHKRSLCAFHLITEGNQKRQNAENITQFPLERSNTKNIPVLSTSEVQTVPRYELVPESHGDPFIKRSPLWTGRSCGYSSIMTKLKISSEEGHVEC
jgi:hypothetical protein